MDSEIKKLREEIQAFDERGPEALEHFRQKISGRKGAIADLFEKFAALPKNEKAALGKSLNELKHLALLREEELKKNSGPGKQQNRPDDLTLPGEPYFTGSRHPTMIAMNRIIDVFSRIGFSIAEGPDLEDGWHNFDALNILASHPARDMQDTFYIETDPEIVLRTHTSNVQIRVMETSRPPIRILAPGRCYRNETVSARAHVYFHQVEGLYVNKEVSFPDLKMDLDYFAREMFGPDTKIRMRPSFFPFTEISAEMDVSCMICKGKGCPVCKYSGWVEILGCGMVDPRVLENCKIDPEEYSGYAFGMGVERIALLLFGIPDLRLLSQNDARFLEQFEGIEL